ncbi:RNA polymerase sigma factor [Jiangella alkaliphila]|uniref:RNA polymerase sigma factor n=1 Tax=Jiangella alkaliphila TaxID=419479 RepID=A0A1H2JNN9_9ACTN|nr:RNA polymerase sigma factor [Jiangella alkaliphila]SDU57756.1 RNA polymerase sigma-70 factor, ECF subfamily [Jiangella alkaliphila]
MNGRTPRTRTEPIADETEQAAIARVRAGDADAYAVLVRRHAAHARRLAVMAGAGPDADDVVQLAFVKAYRTIGTFRDGAPFRPWLLRIVLNETHNATRATRRYRAAAERWFVLDTAAAATADDPATTALADERRTELVAALRELPEPHQRVVACRYLLDLDEEETATVLGWPRGTVKSRLHRALRRLRTQLAPTQAQEVDHG